MVRDRPTSYQWSSNTHASSASNQALKLKYSDDIDTWNKFVSTINESVDKLDLEFRTVHDEVSGSEMYALVSPFLVFSVFNSSEMTQQKGKSQRR